MATKSKKQAQYDDSVIKVTMVTPVGKRPTRTYEQEITRFTSLGKEIRISPKANITVNKPGFSTKFFVDSVNVLIGIGRDHTADLMMTREAWEALNKGAEISITTVKDFKKQFL